MRALVSIVVGALIVLVVVLWIGRNDRPAPTPASPVVPLEPAKLSSAPQSDLTPAATSPQQERVGETNARSSVSTSPHCRVLGRVVDDRGAPLAKQSVIFSPTRSGWIHRSSVDAREEAERAGWFSAVTGADGKFVIDAPLPTGNDVQLAVEPDEFHAYAEVSFGPPPNRPQLVAGDNHVGDIALASCGVAEGRIVAGDGGTVENAAVYVTAIVDRKKSTHTPSWMTDVDRNGRYRLGHIPIGSARFDVFVEAWTRKRGIPVDVSAGNVTSVPDIVLDRAFAIAGTVVDEYGTPLERIPVRSKQGDADGPSGPTHADGSFTLSPTRSDPCVLTIDAPGFELWGGGPDATFTRSVSDVRIHLHRSTIFAFHVIDAVTRAPIERFGLEVVSVPPQGEREKSDDAALALADRPGGNAPWISLRGTFVVHVVAPDHADAAALVAHDAGDPVVQILALQRASGMRGRFVLGGRPLVGADVRMPLLVVDPRWVGSTRIAGSGDNWFAGRARTATSDAQGMFGFDGLSPGTCTLQIDAPSAGHKVLTKLAIPLADVLQLGDIELEPSATIYGTLTVGESESLHDFIATMDARRSAQIDSHGRFTFTGLDAGAHVVSWERKAPISWKDPAVRGQRIELLAGETRDVTLDASASAPCMLTVHLLRDGRPASGLMVLVRRRRHERFDSGEEQLLSEKSSESGTCEGSVDGDLAVELFVVDRNGRILGQISAEVRPSPGGHVDLTYALATGTLVVELPESLVLPNMFLANVRLELPTHDIRYVSMGVRAPIGSVKGPDHHIDLGEVGCGTFEATLTVQRHESDPSASRSGGYVDIRAPYKTAVTIEPGRETKIVVP